MTELPSEADPIEHFKLCVKQLRAKEPEEAEKLGGELLEWASAIAVAINPGASVGDILITQINYKKNKILEQGRLITTNQLIEELFSPNPQGQLTADIIMGRLQL